MLRLARAKMRCSRGRRHGRVEEWLPQVVLRKSRFREIPLDSGPETCDGWIESQIRNRTVFEVRVRRALGLRSFDERRVKLPCSTSRVISAEWKFGQATPRAT